MLLFRLQSGSCAGLRFVQDRGHITCLHPLGHPETQYQVFRGFQSGLLSWNEFMMHWHNKLEVRGADMHPFMKLSQDESNCYFRQVHDLYDIFCMKYKWTTLLYVHCMPQTCCEIWNDPMSICEVYITIHLMSWIFRRSYKQAITWASHKADTILILDAKLKSINEKICYAFEIKNVLFTME